MSLLDLPVLVLNKHFSAIKMTSVKRAFILLYRQRAEVIYKEDGAYYSFSWQDWIRKSGVINDNGYRFINTPRYRVAIPSVVRLLYYSKIPQEKVKLTRKAVIVRDNNTCQYCGKKFATSKLSIDHIIPRSRGGKSTWSNVVAACSNCNMKKAGKTPEEAGMKLIKQPVKVELTQAMPIRADYVREEWNDFLKKN